VGELDRALDRRRKLEVQLEGVRRVQVGAIENVGSCAEPWPTAGRLNIRRYCPTE